MERERDSDIIRNYNFSPGFLGITWESMGDSARLAYC